MLDIYRASCQNIRELKSKRKIIHKMMNKSIRKGAISEIDTITKLYALLYSAYAETSFLKLIHTPYGLTDSEIDVIQNQRNLEDKWSKCFELVFKKIDTKTNAGEIANKKQKLKRILDEYIIKPSQIRNKIAHGQWCCCLNNECTAVNADSTVQIANLDFVRIDVLFEVYGKFQQCIEDLIESQITHYRDYYPQITELEEYIDQTKTWDMSSKISKINGSVKTANFKQRQKDEHT